MHLGKLGLVIMLVVSAVSTLAASPAPTRHPSGIEILPSSPDPATLHLTQVSSELAAAIDDARQLAEKEPTSFGYPYLDVAAGTVVLSTANAAGAQRAQQWTPRALAAGVPRKTRAAAMDFASLERIRNGAIGPGAVGLPDGKAIWMTTRDEERNRVIIVIDHMSDPLLFALASRYGTQAIAVRVDRNPSFHNISRQDDVSPFYGGARIDLPSANYSCSTGFAFTLNGYERIVTAGHCMSRNTTTDTYVYSHYGAPPNGVGTLGMGYIYLNTNFHNWGEKVGTTPINGSYDGDLALITLDTNKASTSRIYSQGTNDEVTAPVRELWSTSPIVGDEFCTGGYATGSLCGWTVTNALSNVQTAGGLNQNVAMGYRSGCAGGGDSGGSVYTVRPDNAIAAKGIMNQTDAGIGQPCRLLFTDLRRVTNPWPGIVLKVQ